MSIFCHVFHGAIVYISGFEDKKKMMSLVLIEEHHLLFKEQIWHS